MKHDSGFSLIELLAATVIVSILAALASIAFTTTVVSYELTRAGQMTSDAISLARQEAVTRNKEVQVRIYQLNDSGPAAWRGIQIWRIDEGENGATAVPITQLQKLPASVAVLDNPTLSPLLTADSSVSSDKEPAGYSGLPYRGFRFRSGGSSGQAITPENNFLTVQRRTEVNALARNYCTLQVNPVTGRVYIYRP